MYKQGVHAHSNSKIVIQPNKIQPIRHRVASKRHITDKNDLQQAVEDIQQKKQVMIPIDGSTRTSSEEVKCENIN